jgi:hypothetical protein
MIDFITPWLLKAANLSRSPGSPVVCATDDELLAREVERVFAGHTTSTCDSLEKAGKDQDAAQCPFESGAVVCFDAIARSGDPAGVIGEIDRLLIPGGLLLMVETPAIAGAGAPGGVTGRDTLDMLAEAGFEILESEVACAGEAGASCRINPDILSRYDRPALIPCSSPAFVIIARKPGNAGKSRRGRRTVDKADTPSGSNGRKPGDREKLVELERMLEAKSGYLERLETYTREIEALQRQQLLYTEKLETECAARGEEIERESEYIRKLENDIGWLQSEVTRLSDGARSQQRPGVSRKLYLSMKNDGIIATLKRSAAFLRKRVGRKES